MTPGKFWLSWSWSCRALSQAQDARRADPVEIEIEIDKRSVRNARLFLVDLSALSSDHGCFSFANVPLSPSNSISIPHLLTAGVILSNFDTHKLLAIGNGDGRKIGAEVRAGRVCV